MQLHRYYTQKLVLHSSFCRKKLAVLPVGVPSQKLRSEVAEWHRSLPAARAELTRLETARSQLIKVGLLSPHL